MTLRQHFSPKFLPATVCLLGSAIFAGCSESEQIDVTSRYGAGVKLSGLGPTYAWAPAPAADSASPPLGSEELRQLIRTTIEKGLAAKGFSQSTTAPADFWIDFRIGKREKTDSGVNPHGEVFEEGSLVLDVLNPQNGKLIWRGVARARILLTAQPDVREKRLNLAVQRLMKDFPPK
jgi:hypothetical protein